MKYFDQFRRRLREDRGQGLVEFAMIVPVMLTAFFVIIELGRLYHAWAAVENGARFGIRYAITGEFDSSNCSGPCDDASEEESARLDTVKDVVWAGSESIIRLDQGTGSNTDQGFFNVTICPPDDLVDPADTFDTFSCSPSEYAGDPGEKVTVVVEYNHPILVPIVSSIVSEVRLTAEREATVETFRQVKADAAPGYSPPPPPPAMTAAPTSTAEEPAGEVYDYCANIVWDGDEEYDDVIFWDQSETLDQMWKFAMLIFNNNEMSMYMTDYFVTWTGPVDLLYIRYGSDCPPNWCSYKLSATNISSGPVNCWTSSSKTKHCGSSSNVEFFSRPGCSSDDCYPQEIYNMFCGDGGPCNYDPWNTGNPTITGSNYTFHAEATFVFRAADTGEAEDVECYKTWDASGNAKDHSGGGSSSWPDPTPPPTPGGGGGGGGSPTSTPDAGGPGD